MADLNIIAPGNTDASGNVFALVVQSADTWSATVDLFLQGGRPDLQTRWTASQGATMEPGASNPFQRYQYATLTGGGTWSPAEVSSFTVVANVGAAEAGPVTVSLLPTIVRLTPDAPVVAVGRPLQFTATPMGAGAASVTFTDTSWRVPAGAIVRQVAPSWSSVEIEFPATAFAAGQIQAVSVTATGGAASMQALVYLAPTSTNDTNATFELSRTGALLLAQKSTTWTSLPPSATWSGQSLAHPALHVLKYGEYTANLAAPVGIVGIACYVMNTYVFGAAADSAVPGASGKRGAD